MGQPLIIYLVVGEESIGAVLVREDGREQYRVYFVSKVLRGAEIRYPEIEKVSLALINDFGEEITYIFLEPYHNCENGSPFVLYIGKS